MLGDSSLSATVFGCAPGFWLGGGSLILHSIREGQHTIREPSGMCLGRGEFTNSGISAQNELPDRSLFHVPEPVGSQGRQSHQSSVISDMYKEARCHRLRDSTHSSQNHAY